jgi:hypothetical protein
MRLDNKVAIITGAGGGIGSATAMVLATRGAQVVLADIHLESAERAAQAVTRAGGSALAQHLDLSSEASIIALVRATIGRFGKIDILHNNAADLSVDLANRDRDVETMDAAVWDRTFRRQPARDHAVLQVRAAAHGQEWRRLHHQHGFQSGHAGKLGASGVCGVQSRGHSTVALHRHLARPARYSLQHGVARPRDDAGGTRQSAAAAAQNRRRRNPDAVSGGAGGSLRTPLHFWHRTRRAT